MTTFYEDLSNQIDSIILQIREGAGANELKAELLELRDALKGSCRYEPNDLSPALSVTVNVKCGTCGNASVSYFEQGEYSLIRCPFCRSEADHQAVKKIWDTAAQFADVNSDIYNNTKGLNRPCFQFDLISRLTKMRNE
jgi:DNA-directed RNA polymerase subunit RPC12/RpoP